MTLPQLIGLIVGLLSILGTVVALTVHITKLQAQLQQAKLEAELNSARQKLTEIENSYSDLSEKHKTAITAGGVITGKIYAIEYELASLSDALEANSSSILVPVPSELDEEPKELVFLTLLGKGSEKLKGVRVPLGSIAGDIFIKKKPRIIHAPQKESAVSAKTDEVSNISTNEMLAFPLMHKAKCVGVIEFLNKKDNKQFNDVDLERVERSIGSIATKVGDFIQEPNNFGLLGITPKTRATEASILFSDLSRSAVLIKRFDASVVIDFINEYFEALCNVAIRRGGRIDKFIGDGFMVTFNVQHPILEHEFAAMTTALEMQSEFDKVKRKWEVFNIPDIHNRIGISCGPVYKAEVGHSLTRQLTVMGEAVNLASNLCDLGDRNRNVIIIGNELYARAASKIVVDKAKDKGPREVKQADLIGYELISVNE
ncbi:MAG TPA: adenylate/guanylate cyclase domain-containing protein [Pyrinomonadaceae bacterium]|nr:adenylate/guanylate cyclase domain-containing protein [Pyrinomonadaceae bacterium]